MKFKLTVTIPTTPHKVYTAWLSSKVHAAMTGGDAKCTKRKHGTFTAWDGYINGTNLELTESSYIKQAWRTVEFKEDQPDSILEISLTAKGKGQTLLTLVHSALSVNDNKYRQGWIDSYFNPMKKYFDIKSKK